MEKQPHPAIREEEGPNSPPVRRMPKMLRGWETQGRNETQGGSVLSAVMRPRFHLPGKSRLEPGQEVSSADAGLGVHTAALPVPSCRCWAPSFPGLQAEFPLPPPTLHRHTQSRENEVSFFSGIAKA